MTNTVARYGYTITATQNYVEGKPFVDYELTTDAKILFKALGDTDGTIFGSDVSEEVIAAFLVALSDEDFANLVQGLK